MKNKVIQQSSTLAAQINGRINRSARGVILGTRKKLWNDPTRRIINALAALILGFALGPALLSGTAQAAEVDFSVVVPSVPVLEMVVYDGATGGDVIENGGSKSITVTPKMATAGFSATDLSVTVGTSSLAGYNLTMYADNSRIISDNGLSLSNVTNTDLVSSTGNTLSTLGEGTFTCTVATGADCNFTPNAWGYRLSTDAADTYKSVPGSETELTNYTDGATNGQTTTVTFASRVNAQQPAGTYTTTINFIATANPTALTINDVTSLQDFATMSPVDYADVLDSMTEGQAYERPDNRDNKKYNIAKLADGNIWFLDNLRLDPNVTTLTSANTNVTSTPSITFTNKTSGWNGDSAYTEAYYNLGSEDSTQSYGSGSNRIGGYYNYCAASAGSYCMNSSSGSGNASQDLCPAGWRMPTGGTGGEYATLAQAITGAYGNLNGTNRTNFMEAAHISLSGNFWDASAKSQGSGATLLSSTLGSDSSMHRLLLNTSTVYPADSVTRNSGYSIRCLARLGSEMQKSTSATLAHKITNVNDAATLVDARDYQPYTVAKLADNKIWMTKNLNLPGGTEIESTKSDVPEDYVLPTANGFQSGNKLPATETISSGTTLANSNAFSDNSIAYVFNSNSTTCSSSSPCYSYYSWTTATAGSGTNITTDNTDAEYSICPKGWKLPNTRTGTDNSSDFRALMIAYGGSDTIAYYSSSTNPTGETFYGLIGPNSTLNLLLTGQYSIGKFYAGEVNGYYWASTVLDNTNARELTLGTTGINSATDYSRRNGFAVRCILAN